MRKLVIVLLLVALINCQDDGPMKIDVPPDFQKFENNFVLTDRKIENFVPEVLQQQIKEEVDHVKQEIEKQNIEEKEKIQDLIQYVNNLQNEIEQKNAEAPATLPEDSTMPFPGTPQLNEEAQESESSSSDEQKRGRHGQRRHGGRKGGREGKQTRFGDHTEGPIDPEEAKSILEHRNRWRQRHEKKQDQTTQTVAGSEPLLTTGIPEEPNSSNTFTRPDYKPSETRKPQENEDSSSSESSSEEQDGAEFQEERKYQAGDEHHGKNKNHMKRFKHKFRKGGFKGPIFILLFVGVIVFACKKCKKQRRANNLQEETHIPQIITVPHQNQPTRYVQLTDEQLQILQQQQFRAAPQQQQPVIVGVPIQQQPQQPRQQVFIPQAFQVQAVPQVSRPQSQNAGIVIEMNPRRYPQINAEDIPVGQPVNNQYNYPQL